MCKKLKSKKNAPTPEINRQEVDRFVENAGFSSAYDERTLGYVDPFVTDQQKERDKKITELLAQYVDFYKRKVKHSVACRYIILIPCVIIVGIFAGLLVHLALSIGNYEQETSVEDLAAFVTACISFISLIIGLLTIITKYFFPENDEQYIAKIVDSIQTNDLENKKENAKHKTEAQLQLHEKMELS